jgi:predicted CxxxxCH...CXXCH cytochrome family protein
MRLAPSFLLPALLAGLLASACGSTRAPEEGRVGPPTTGAHTAHLRGGPLAPPIGENCGYCHAPGYQLTFPQGPGASNGATPSYSYATKTCSGVYCHAGGASLPLGGGTNMAPTWDPPSPIACGSCHALPGQGIDTPWHPAIATGAECGLCHPGYTATSVNTPIHVNGVLDLTVPMVENCAACHGTADRPVPPGVAALVRVAPPVDTLGHTAATHPGVGAHQAHLAPGPNAVSAPIACSECHVVPTDLVHVGPTAGTPATLTWGPLASAGGARPSYSAAPGFTCTNYCHGQTIPYGSGSNTRPVWTVVNGSQATCGTCHALPPAQDTHVLHAVTLALGCETCHGAGYTPRSVAVSTHVDGRLTLGPGFENWSPTAPGPGGWTGTATGCHGGTRYWSAGTAPGCF